MATKLNAKLHLSIKGFTRFALFDLEQKCKTTKSLSLYCPKAAFLQTKPPFVFEIAEKGF